MEARRSMSVPWWAYSAFWAIGTAVVVAILLPTPIGNWKVVVAIGFIVFASVSWLNPKLRYWRLAGQLLGLWGVSRLGSKLLVYLGSEQGTLAFAFENEASGMFDFSIAVCLVVVLFLDYLTRNSLPFGQGVKQLLNIKISRQTIETNQAHQTNIAQAEVVNIYSSNSPPSQQDLDDALTQSAATASPSVREGVCHDQIDAAVAYMKEGKVDVAIEFLLRLRTRDWDHMTEREKFRAAANLGHCRSRREEYEQAAMAHD